MSDRGKHWGGVEARVDGLPVSASTDGDTVTLDEAPRKRSDVRIDYDPVKLGQVFGKAEVGGVEAAILKVLQRKPVQRPAVNPTARHEANRKQRNRRRDKLAKASRKKNRRK